MKKTKYTVSLLIMMLMVISSTNAQKYFRIIDAVSTSWEGGMVQSGSGTEYKVRVILLTDQKITFTDMWAGKEYGVPSTASFSYTDGRRLVKGDTAIVAFKVVHYPPSSPMSKMQVTVHKDPPAPLKGEGLLGYTIGKKIKYRDIDAYKKQAEKKYL